MGIKAFIAKLLAKKRAAELKKIARNPVQTQENLFHSLIQSAKNTAFGKDFGFSTIRSVSDFQRKVPVKDYEQNKHYYERVLNGEKDVLWKGKPLYLAKTSGTTSGAKYIPITAESIRYQIQGAKDILLMYIYHTGNADFLNGKMMFLSGSPVLDIYPSGMKTGRLSGIVNHFVPGYLQTNKVPSYETNCIEDWETKVKTIVHEVKNKDLRLISGIPPWVQMLFEEAQAQTGKKPTALWKNLQVFIHGGVDFSAYRKIFDSFFDENFGKKPDMLELYPASEGFFAFQDDLREEGLLLILDGGIFYEFIPLEAYGKPSARRLTLQEVVLNHQYALIVSTNAGLWAYDTGDTIKFVSLNPHRIRVTGRVKHFLSLFGEHVIAEEVTFAINEAAGITNATVQEFTVAPFLSSENGESFHDWYVEFTQLPDNMDLFIETLDKVVRAKNVYYNDLREGKLLTIPKVRVLTLNASREYMKSAGKLGGQNKFPKLSNDRRIADFLINYQQ
ncbi:MAG: GH3 auxin-responsive promoter family protein [Bacteroidia bacterium]|nr:GH3 auxin-responsive promoter family protein [Bacteroidia bacterium]